MNGDQRKLGWWDVAERLAKIASVLLIPILLWGISVELRLQKIPAERENYVAKNVTPEWVKTDISVLKSDVKELGRDFASMRVEISGRFGAIEALLRDQ